MKSQWQGQLIPGPDSRGGSLTLPVRLWQVITKDCVWSDQKDGVG